MIGHDPEDLLVVQSENHDTEQRVLPEYRRRQERRDISFAGRREVGEIDLEQGPNAIECLAETRRAVWIGAQVDAHGLASLSREDHAAVRQDE